MKLIPNSQCLTGNEYSLILSKAEIKGLTIILMALESVYFGNNYTDFEEHIKSITSFEDEIVKRLKIALKVYGDIFLIKQKK